MREFIDAILQADQQAPRKQRHTAQRIWQRIGQEQSDASISSSTVRRYVRQRRAELGLATRETFIPQVYAWGSEAQVDWYEAVAEIAGERQQVHNFSMRSMASGGAFMWPITTPRRRRSWKRTSWPFATSAACSACCATTT